jgi:hypothetical protein
MPCPAVSHLQFPGRAVKRSRTLEPPVQSYVQVTSASAARAVPSGFRSLAPPSTAILSIVYHSAVRAGAGAADKDVQRGVVLELDPERLSARDDLQRNVLEMQTHVTAVLEDIRCAT